MKTYSVNFSKNGEFVSSFTIVSDSLINAKKRAQSHKRLHGFKGCTTTVRYDKYPVIKLNRNENN